jgi:predicted Fe-Mo cluster-binding NifX family protein
MKVAFTTTGDTLGSPMDKRFGRAPKFLVFDLETGGFEVIDNGQNLNAPQGAGIQSAQNVAKAGASSLVTGHCGPKAFRVLQAAGVAVYTTDASTVAEAISLFRSGALTKALSPDVDGHWA